MNFRVSKGWEYKFSTGLGLGNPYNTKCPILKEFFLVYGGAATSSSPSERLFSLNGYQVWDRRNKISSERVEYPIKKKFILSFDIK
ncbi:hypothetical protein BpHYR1_043867 [Brachionus plicatilis]|uniref:HAT C-terminal dimerisation domain-containing protein n=1 Tax=Brachionus plicatilis TaxID=10195 RepID=A0A3M7S9F2_BRAPC|nr:hypothetical protein BpHYR1_043867 [Brachionus plicatilis]